MSYPTCIEKFKLVIWIPGTLPPPLHFRYVFIEFIIAKSKQSIYEFFIATSFK